MGTTDTTTGVYFYEDTDAVSPLHTLLNLGQTSINNALKAAARIYAVANTTVRTALINSYAPTANKPLYMDRIDLGGVIERHSGTASSPIARPISTGYASGTTDSNGFLSVPAHGLGVQPTAVNCTPGQTGWGSEPDLLMTDFVVWEQSATGFTVRARRLDANAWKPNTPVGFAWVATK